MRSKADQGILILLFNHDGQYYGYLQQLETPFI